MPTRHKLRKKTMKLTRNKDFDCKLPHFHCPM
jgi:hypothetical protein